MNKYYVGARHIAHSILNGEDAECTWTTLAEAIDEAKEKVEEGEVECAIVVKIVRVVKRSRPPVTVEEV